MSDEAVIGPFDVPHDLLVGPHLGCCHGCLPRELAERFRLDAQALGPGAQIKFDMTARDMVELNAARIVEIIRAAGLTARNRTRS